MLIVSMSHWSACEAVTCFPHDLTVTLLSNISKVSYEHSWRFALTTVVAIGWAQPMKTFCKKISWVL